MLAQFQFSRLPLYVFPIHANVELRSERDLHQLLDRLSQGLSLFLRRAHFVANIANESHSVVRDDFARGSECHNDIPAGIVVRGERALIEPVGNTRPGTEVVAVEVMWWDVCEQGLGADPESS